MNVFLQYMKDYALCIHIFKPHINVIFTTKLGLTEYVVFFFFRESADYIG